jgi:hypothetical protein
LPTSQRAGHSGPQPKARPKRLRCLGYGYGTSGWIRLRTRPLRPGGQGRTRLDRTVWTDEPPGQDLWYGSWGKGFRGGSRGPPREIRRNERFRVPRLCWPLRPMPPTRSTGWAQTSPAFHLSSSLRALRGPLFCPFSMKSRGYGSFYAQYTIWGIPGCTWPQAMP